MAHNSSIKLFKDVEYHKVPHLAFIYISADGIAYNARTKRFSKPIFHRGVWKVRTRDINGRVKDAHLARVLAEVFIPVPAVLAERKISELFVVYKDDDHSNHSLGNLEWSPDAPDLVQYQRPSVKTGHVLARNVLTGEVRCFDGYTLCGFAFNITPCNLKRHIYSADAGYLTFDWWVFRLRDSDTEWPELTPQQRQRTTLVGKRILIHNRVQNRKVVVGTKKAIVEYTGIPLDRFTKKLSIEGVYYSDVYTIIDSSILTEADFEGVTDLRKPPITTGRPVVVQMPSKPEVICVSILQAGQYSGINPARITTVTKNPDQTGTVDGILFKVLSRNHGELQQCAR